MFPRITRKVRIEDFNVSISISESTSQSRTPSESTYDPAIALNRSYNQSTTETSVYYNFTDNAVQSTNETNVFSDILKNNQLLLTHQIDKGSYGTCYSCFHDNREEWVAIKVIIGSIDQRTFRQNHGLDNDLDILLKIDHPNMIPLIDYIVCDQYSILIFPLMTTNLTDCIIATSDWLYVNHRYKRLELFSHRVTRKKPDENVYPSLIKWEWIEPVCRAVINGLAYLHKNNIYHRDIKPDNICINVARLDYCTADTKICYIDFGMSVNVTNPKFTECIGSPGYRPPEYYNVGRCIDAEYVDVWGLGCLLFVLVVGNLPPDIDSLTNGKFHQETGVRLMHQSLEPFLSGKITSKWKLSRWFKLKRIIAGATQTDPFFRLPANELLVMFNKI